MVEPSPQSLSYTRQSCGWEVSTGNEAVRAEELKFTQPRTAGAGLSQHRGRFWEASTLFRVVLLEEQENQLQSV